MKKIKLLLLFLSTLCGYAQVSNYTFQQTSETYTGISEGKILGSESSDTQYYVDETVPLGGSANTGAGLPIGFNFIFNSTVYDRFGISTDGWISLGISTVSPAVGLSSTNRFKVLESSSPNIPNSTSPNPLLGSRIAGLSAVNLAAQVGAELRYQTIGSTPNRVLVIQWKNYKKSGTTGDGDFYNFQIRLYETTNLIKITYGSFTNNANSADFQVGLRAAPLDVASNYAIRTSSTVWDSSVAGSIIKNGSSYVADKITINNLTVPSSGLTFTWTPPACGNPTGLVISSVTNSSAILNWSANTPTPTAYEYFVSTSAYPPTTSGTATSNTNATISGLNSNTLYYVFLRSDCGFGFNNGWVLGGTFRTKCDDLTYFYEDFDNYNYADKVMPNCWENTGTTGSAYIISDGTNPKLGSAPNKLYLKADGSTGTVAYAIMPKVSNLQAGTNSLKFQAYASDIERFLDVGYFTNSADPSSFVLLQKLALPSAAAVSSAPEFIVTPGVLPAGVKSLVFRNTGVAVGQTLAYIDNVVWDRISSCPDIKDIVVKGFTGNSVNLSWTKGGTETTWQYAVGSLTQSDPNSLAAVDFNSPVTTGTDITGTANTLTASTSYKIWIRAKCTDGSLGGWIGPVLFSTTCVSVSEFQENFDADTTLPSCWSKVGTTGTVAKATGSNPVSPSAPYVVGLTSSSPTASAIVSMPPLNNSGAGNHRLRFKLRGSVSGATIDIGYLTNVSDASTFVYLQSFTASSATAYEEIITNLGSDPKSAYLAFRNPGNIDSSVYIDDVIWEQTPACNDVKDLSSNEISSTSIKLRWTMGGSESKWQYALGSSAVTDPSTLTAFDFATPIATGSTVAGAVSNLNPSTSYKIWVRSKCNGTGFFGAWIGPIAFSTTCSPVTDFVQRFDTSTNFPSCWSKVGSGGSAYPTSIAAAPTLPNALYMSSSSANSPAVVVMQPVSNAGDASHRLKFKFQGSVVGAPLEVGYLINALDPTTFVSVQSFPATSKFQNITVELGFDPGSEFLAFRNAGSPASDIYVDDVVWEPIPTAVPVAATGIKSLPNPSCGNFATTISWDHVTGVNGYKISVGTAAGLSDVVNNADLGDVLSYSFMGSINATYYFTVKPYNSFGNATGNSEQSFVTNANGCYCASTPISTDGGGITNVQINATNFVNTAKGYYDYTSKQINLAQGVNAKLAITLNTGVYPYMTNVWVDFNDDYNFDSSELVALGMSPLAMPYVLDASFMVPATAKLGTHRMRIASARTGQNEPNPCYSFLSGVTLDFKVNIIVPVANDEAIGAIALTAGNAFAANAIVGTNVNATGSIVETEPGCGGYNGDDVWYSAIVPNSGNITFEINSVPGGITNSAAAVYSSSVSSLALINCNDSGSTAGDDHAKISLTGRAVGEKLYLRVWENGGDASGSFKVSAYDTTASVLGIDTLNTAHFSYYPNPVKDILNLSFSQEINDLTVFNMLGQEIISKSINANQAKIDMSGLYSGTYLVKVTAGNQSKTIKVMKE